MQNNFLKDTVKFIEPESLELRGVITKAKTRANGYPTFICPECGNGTGKTGDGLVVYKNSDGYAYHCNKSGCHFDNISLLGRHYGLDTRRDFQEILHRAADDFGIVDTSDFENYHYLQKKSSPNSLITNSNKEEKTETLAQDSPLLAPMIENDIARAINCLEELPLADRRGLSLETFKYFRCGFLSNWVHPKILLEGKNIKPTRRIIIPISLSHYIAVALDSDRKKDESEYWKIPKPYWKMKVKTQEYTGFFGSSTITDKTELILIFEGEIDAMTAYQAIFQNNFLQDSMKLFGVDSATDLETGEIITASNLTFKNIAYIATGSASSKTWIKALNCICNHYKIKPRIIILFDNDEAGKTNAPRCMEELVNLGYSVSVQF